MDEKLSIFHAKRGSARRAYTRFVADSVGAVDLSTLSREVPWKDRPAFPLKAVELPKSRNGTNI